MAAGTTSRPFGDLVDRALEASVVGSFSRIGFVSRRALGLIGPLDERLDGRACWVTGGSSGLGLTTAIGLARLGAHLRLVVRDEQRGIAAAARIRAETGASDVRVEVCDIRRSRRCAARVADPRARRPRARARPQRRRARPPAPRDSGRRRADVRDERARPVPAHDAAARAPARLGARARAVRHVGRHVHAAARRRRPAVARGAVRRPAVYSRTKRAEMALCRSGPTACAAAGSSCTRCIPGWADTPGIRARCPASRARSARCCARPRRGRTRSSGSHPPASPRRRAAALARPAPEGAPPPGAHAREQGRARLPARACAGLPECDAALAGHAFAAN